MNFKEKMDYIVNVLSFLLCSLFVSATGRSMRSICQSSMDALSDSGVKIEPLQSSRIFLASLSTEFTAGHELSFEFKTTSKNGLLFYTTRRNDPTDMVSLSIVHGRVKYRIRCKSSYVDQVIPKTYVNDGEWHKVIFRRRGQKGVLYLDGDKYYRHYSVTCGGFTSVGLGNVSPEHQNVKVVKDLKTESSKFVGCIRRLHISTGIEAPPHYVTVSDCN